MALHEAWGVLGSFAERLGVPLSQEQLEQLARYHEALVKANEVVNLTRVTDPAEAAIKHHLDGLLFLKALPEGAREKSYSFVDVGTGPGLPGITLLVACPRWRGTLIDSVGKKVAFVDASIEALGLQGQALQCRAEDLGREPGHRDRHDLVVARAVARLPELIELCLPLLRVGGHFVASKGPSAEEERAEAKAALHELRGSESAFLKHELPMGAGERLLWRFTKEGPTPKPYPRRAGEPHRRPIGVKKLTPDG